MEELLSGIEGVTSATQLTEDATAVDLGSPSQQGGVGQYVIKDGNVAVLQVIDWQCAWTREFVDAADAGDNQRADASAAQLETFTSLDTINTYSPDLKQAQDDIFDPMIAGDIQKGWDWLSNSCSGYRAGSPPSGDDGGTSIRGGAVLNIPDPWFRVVALSGSAVACRLRGLGAGGHSATMGAQHHRLATLVQGRTASRDLLDLNRPPTARRLTAPRG